MGGVKEERGQRNVAESEVPPPAADDEALVPAPGSARLDEEVEPIAVAMPARRGRAHERGREGLVGMAPFGFGFRDGADVWVTSSITS